MPDNSDEILAASEIYCQTLEQIITIVYSKSGEKTQGAVKNLLDTLSMNLEVRLSDPNRTSLLGFERAKARLEGFLEALGNNQIAN